MRSDVLAAVRDTPNPVVLFDVDSTLLSTAPRHLGILRAFAAREGRPELVEGLSAADFGWTVDGPLPELDAPARAALLVFWREAFFGGDFLHLDVPLPGAVEFVRKVHRAGAWVVFLTARLAPEMGRSTVTSLLDLGFPLLDGRFLLQLKPSASVPDHTFKTLALRDLHRLGTMVATYENEPANANLFQQTFPGSQHYLLKTVHSPDAPVLHGAVRPIVDFL